MMGAALVAVSILGIVAWIKLSRDRPTKSKQVAAKDKGEKDTKKDGKKKGGPKAKWDHLNIPQGKIVDDFVRLDKPGSFIWTKQAFSGDIEITVVARTAKYNIRLYAFYGASVIFNWDVKPDELRVHRPDGNKPCSETGSVTTANVQPLAPDTWYRLRWRITSKGMKVFVNNNVVFSEVRKNDLSRKAPVFLTRIESTVDVKEFLVKKLVNK
jgi:hypothetical protein